MGIELGQKISLVAAFKKECYAKEDWKICLFETTIDPNFVPGNYPADKVGQKLSFTTKGKIAPNYVGESYELTGEWAFSKKDKEYQFSIQLAVPCVPTGEEDVKNFVRHSVKGVGPKLAEEIVCWCDGDLQRISNNPRVLAASIKGVSERKAKLLAARIDEASATSALARLLKRVVDPKYVRTLVSAYGQDAYETVSKHPYDTIGVIGFEMADRIALAMDFKPRKPERIEAAALYALNMLRARNCAIIVAKDLHRAKMMQLLEMNVPRNSVSGDDINAALNSLKKKGVIAGVSYPSGFFYLREDWEMERKLAQRICDLGQYKTPEDDAARFTAAFDEWKYRHPDIRLHPNQANAVRAAANLFSVVTGGPGTGKTTVLKAIMETYSIIYPDSPITLMAPTGLAAKRMSESCGMKAKTIHKVLGLTPADTPSGFEAARDAKIHGGLVIIDEVSMVGIHLADFLLNAIEVRADTHIVFVGDVDQLPPVTPGCVLNDLIGCKKVHVTRLTKNFRQAAGSNIADIAVKVNRGDAAGIRYGNDCIFTKVGNDDDIVKTVVQEFQKSVVEFGLDQTFVITPTHKSLEDPLSSNSLNRILQDVVNPQDGTKEEVVVNKGILRIGDRVINKKNGTDVINGDIGKIIEFIPEDVGVSLKINFAGNVVTFPPEKLKNLELAYCITVHSSQGCEFASVITPVSKRHELMLTRNLTYTAITRAKKKMHLIGDMAQMTASVTNIRETAKSDLLMARIASAKPQSSAPAQKNP